VHCRSMYFSSTTTGSWNVRERSWHRNTRASIVPVGGGGAALHCRVQGQQQQQQQQQEYSVDTYTGSRIPFRVLSKACGLLAEVFGGQHNQMTERNESTNNLYRLRLMAALQSRACLEQEGFSMCVTTDENDGSVVGVVTLSKGIESATSGSSVTLPVMEDESDATEYYSVCNMAVRESCRRQGIARRMLNALEQQCSGAVVYYILSVDMYNTDAKFLYESEGYQEEASWLDPRWASSIDRVDLDDIVPRRILMYKKID
jgi:ribosomal protein S18 acetylase RimI-like enzyme